MPFIKIVHSEHARFQSMLLCKNRQFPDTSYNNMIFTFIFLRYTEQCYILTIYHSVLGVSRETEPIVWLGR